MPSFPLLSASAFFRYCPCICLCDAGGPQAEVTAESETVIIVTAERVRGAVETDAAPIDELSEADVQALGGSSVADIVAAVAPQAGSGAWAWQRPAGDPAQRPAHFQLSRHFATCRRRRSSRCRFSPKRLRCNMAFVLING
ncbi:MAG: hypothetical protein IPL18_12165 [Sphingomonadales bacterium]|nr:hypothetical protein [Sphingomonadales bacterium]